MIKDITVKYAKETISNLTPVEITSGKGNFGLLGPNANLSSDYLKESLDSSVDVNYIIPVLVKEMQNIRLRQDEISKCLKSICNCLHKCCSCECDCNFDFLNEY